MRHTPAMTSAATRALPATPLPLARAWDWFCTSGGALWLLAALFLLPRALLILLHVTPTSDADWYFWQAQNLAGGKGYVGGHGEPTAFWPPGWPMALSLAIRAGGASPLTVGLFNLLWAALAGLLTHDLARRLFGTEAAARTAVLLLALYPNSALYVPLALTEVFYTALLLGACWLLVARQGTGWLLLAGAVFGLATLVKAQTLVVVPLFFAIAVLRGPVRPRAIAAGLMQAALVLAAAAAVVAPWTIRNHRELGAWVPVSTNGGWTLLTGNNDSARGDYTPDDPTVVALGQRKAELGELAVDAEAKRLGRAWIEAHPARFAALAPRKVVRLWLPDGEGMWAYEQGTAAFARARPAFIGLRLANQAWYFALLAGFAAAGFAMARKRRHEGERVIDWWLLPYGIAAYPTAIALVFSGQSRFHYPVMPWVCMAAGWWLASLIDGRARAARLRVDGAPALL